MVSRNVPPRWAVTTIMPALGGASRMSCHSSAEKSDFVVIVSPIGLHSLTLVALTVATGCTLAGARASTRRWVIVGQNTLGEQHAQVGPLTATMSGVEPSRSRARSGEQWAAHIVRYIRLVAVGGADEKLPS